MTLRWPGSRRGPPLWKARRRRERAPRAAPASDPRGAPFRVQLQDPGSCGAEATAAWPSSGRRLRVPRTRAARAAPRTAPEGTRRITAPPSLQPPASRGGQTPARRERAEVSQGKAGPTERHGFGHSAAGCGAFRWCFWGHRTLGGQQPLRARKTVFLAGVLTWKLFEVWHKPPLAGQLIFLLCLF